jgi:hypothetical protein
MSPRTQRPPSCRFPVPVPCRAEGLEGRVLLSINRGSNALAVGADGKPLAADQRGDGFARVVGGRVDIGAFEAQGRILNQIFDEPDGGGIGGK